MVAKPFVAIRDDRMSDAVKASDIIGLQLECFRASAARMPAEIRVEVGLQILRGAFKRVAKGRTKAAREARLILRQARANVIANGQIDHVQELMRFASVVTGVSPKPFRIPFQCQTQ